MKRYIVKALSVGGLNKVFNSGDLVTDAHFPEGHAEKLVAQGFLRHLNKDEQAKFDKAEHLEKEKARRAEEEARKKLEAEKLRAAEEEEARKKAEEAKKADKK